VIVQKTINSQGTTEQIGRLCDNTQIQKPGEDGGFSWPKSAIAGATSFLKIEYLKPSK
jgi:hypothetical protein